MERRGRQPRLRVAAPGPVVGAHLHQQRDRLRHPRQPAPHRQRPPQRGERQQHQVVALRGVGAFVLQHRGQFGAVQQRQRAGADHHRRAAARAGSTPRRAGWSSTNAPGMAGSAAPTTSTIAGAGPGCALPRPGWNAGGDQQQAGREATRGQIAAASTPPVRRQRPCRRHRPERGSAASSRGLVGRQPERQRNPTAPVPSRAPPLPGRGSRCGGRARSTGPGPARHLTARPAAGPGEVRRRGVMADSRTFLRCRRPWAAHRHRRRGPAPPARPAAVGLPRR